MDAQGVGQLFLRLLRVSAEGPQPFRELAALRRLCHKLRNLPSLWTTIPNHPFNLVNHACYLLCVLCGRRLIHHHGVEFHEGCACVTGGF